MGANVGDYPINMISPCHVKHCTFEFQKHVFINIISVFIFTIYLAGKSFHRIIIMKPKIGENKKKG